MVSNNHYNTMVVIRFCVLDFLFLFHVLRWICVNFSHYIIEIKKKMECIVCQDAKGKEKLVATPSEESFRKLLECARERAKYRDGTVVELVERTKDTTKCTSN